MNRVWLQLFGQGLVSTADNFGVNGEAPSHPELLDHLALEFVREGWSIKKLVRKLALSHTYRLSSEATPRHREIDPANRLLWRHSPRRLHAEELRDALLAAAGRLDVSSSAGSVAKQLNMIELRDDGPESFKVLQHADQTTVRSVYLPLLRGLTPRSIEVFDPVAQTLVTGQRESTTVPAQALFLLNSPFVRRQALTLAERLLQDQTVSTPKRIRAAYRRVINRDPSHAELSRVSAFLSTYSAQYRAVEPQRVVPLASFKPAAELPVDQDEERGSYVPDDEQITPRNPDTAAWMSFVQALFASAEFRFLH